MGPSREVGQDLTAEVFKISDLAGRHPMIIKYFLEKLIGVSTEGLMVILPC